MLGRKSREGGNENEKKRRASVRSGGSFLGATVACAMRSTTVMARCTVVQSADENSDDDEGEDRGGDPGIVEGRVACGVRGR